MIKNISKYVISSIAMLALALLVTVSASAQTTQTPQQQQLQQPVQQQPQQTTPGFPDTGVERSTLNGMLLGLAALMLIGGVYAVRRLEKTS